LFAPTPRPRSRNGAGLFASAPKATGDHITRFAAPFFVCAETFARMPRYEDEPANGDRRRPIHRQGGEG